MPYVVKHKSQPRYLSGTKSKKADHDSDGLVSLEFARIFPTEAGAETAVKIWAKKWDATVVDEKKLEWARQFHDPLPGDVLQMCYGSVVVDDAKLDMVEIVPVKIGEV